MKINSTENLSPNDIFRDIVKHQILALMFHDQMRDLYDFLNLSGFRAWHEHQYINESKEFLCTKSYFMKTHNKLLDISDTGQPKIAIPENWYKYNRFDVTSQLLRQYTEISLNEYKVWEEDTKRIYEEYSKALFTMGYIADSEKIQQLIRGVSQELNEIYEVMLKLRSTEYDAVYILDIQDKICKKFK